MPVRGCVDCQSQKLTSAREKVPSRMLNLPGRRNPGWIPSPGRWDFSSAARDFHTPIGENKNLLKFSFIIDLVLFCYHSLLMLLLDINRKVPISNLLQKFTHKITLFIRVSISFLYAAVEQPFHQISVVFFSSMCFQMIIRYQINHVTKVLWMLFLALYPSWECFSLLIAEKENPSMSGVVSARNNRKSTTNLSFARLQYIPVQSFTHSFCLFCLSSSLPHMHCGSNLPGIHPVVIFLRLFRVTSEVSPFYGGTISIQEKCFTSFLSKITSKHLLFKR